MSWADLRHAAIVSAIAAATVLLYERLGFILTMAAMLFTLTALAERRSPLAAMAFSLGVTALTYVLFVYALKTPLEMVVLGFLQ